MYYVTHPSMIPTLLVIAKNGPGTIQSVVVVCSCSTSHLMGPALGPPFKSHGPRYGHGGWRRGSGCTSTLLMSSAPARTGPSNTQATPWAEVFDPASHGRRPRQAHLIPRSWTAARPGPTAVQSMGRGLVPRPPMF